jgi:tRNA threonylcarbamoyladenosine biosynthesis protein TsaE
MSEQSGVELSCITRGEDQTIALGVAFARILRPCDVVAIDGQLGAGKTRFVRGVARGLGVDESRVASPTYVIVHQYPAHNDQGLSTLNHVDAYRLHGAEELESIGWDTVVGDDGTGHRAASTLIEWAGRIEPSLREIDPERLCRVQLAVVDDAPDRRRVRLTIPDPWLDRAPSGQIRTPSPGEAVVDAFVRFGAPLPAGWARCPTTQRAVSPANATFPFADEQARMADLGKWFSGSYQVSRELTEEDLDDPDLRPPRPSPTGR